MSRSGDKSVRKEIIALAVVGVVVFFTVYSVRMILMGMSSSKGPSNELKPSNDFKMWPGATETKLWVEFLPDNYIEWEENTIMRVLLSNGEENEIIIESLYIGEARENGRFPPLPLASKRVPLPPGYTILLEEKKWEGSKVGDPQNLSGPWRVRAVCWTSIENFVTHAYYYVAPPTS